MSNVENEEDTKSKKSSRISGPADWALIFGVTTTVLVAGGLTAYMIKKKRDEELAIMRYGNNKEVQEQNLFQYTIATLSSYWQKAPSIFNQINVKVTSFLRSLNSSNQGPLQGGNTELSTYEDNSE